MSHHHSYHHTNESTTTGSTSSMERDATKAAEEIRASLALWTSPQLGTIATVIGNNNNNNVVEPQRSELLSLSSSVRGKKSDRYHYDMNDLDAWEQDAHTDNEENDIFMDTALSLSLTTMTKNASSTPTERNSSNGRHDETSDTESKRTKTFHRSTTPIMSNHSKQQQQHDDDDVVDDRRTLTVVMGDHNNNNNIEEEEEDDDEVPYNINSPWVTTGSSISSSSTNDKNKNNHLHRTPSTTTTKKITKQRDVAATTTTTRTGFTTVLPNRTAMIPTPTPSRHHANQATSTAVVVVNPNNYCAIFQPYYTATERLWRFHQTQYHHPNDKPFEHADSNTTTTTIATINNDMMLIDPTTTTTTTRMSSTKHDESNALHREGMKVELDFIMTLHRYCWSSSTTGHSSNLEISFSHKQMEGNFWLLIYHLRQLGIATLLWDDDIASKQQHDRFVQSHIQSISTQTQCTPAAIIKSLYNNNNNNNSTNSTTTKNMTTTTTTAMAPLPIQRRKQLLTWLHQCFQNILPSDVLRPRRTNKIFDQTKSSQMLNQCGLYRTNKDDEVLQACLSLLLAGRFNHDALDLVRNSNLHWRAAVWGGNIPHGYTTATSVSNSTNQYMIMDDINDTTVVDINDTTPNLVSVGNPSRALWRRMMWKHSEQLEVDGRNEMKQSNAEVAIAALLSSNVKLALDCPLLRKWECGLYTVVRCLNDRMEDDVLHRHNNYRRSIQNSGGPLFPGTEYETSEREHLQASCDIANMDEGDAIRMILDSSPFEEMRGDDIIHQATASFIMGKSAILTFVQKCVERVADLTEDELRFVTHVTFYLDAFSYSTTTPVVLQNIKQWKNELVMQYIHLLASHEDLWYMIVLYASFLPVNTILDRLPSLLLNMDSMEERKVIVQQLREFLPPGQNLDLEVLRRIVALVNSESENSDDEEHDVNGATNLLKPSTLDIRKMESVLWLSIQNDHAGEALIAANSLLRKFFLSGDKKISSAMLFVDEVLNDFLTNFVSNVDDSAMNDDDDNNNQKIENARLEHLAYLSFLEATKSVRNWKNVLRETNHTLLELEDDDIDKSVLNGTELSIAMNAERRKIIDIKRTATQKVVAVAESACKNLRQILEHPGGWLSTVDEDLPPNDVDAILRRKELDQLHCELLPQLVFMYHDVCTGTASWMSKSLDDTSEALNIAAKDAVREIDATFIDGNTVTSPVAPRYWTQQALELAEMTMKGTYNVRSAFHTSDYKSLVSRLAETTAIDCMYRYAE